MFWIYFSAGVAILGIIATAVTTINDRRNADNESRNLRNRVDSMTNSLQEKQDEIARLNRQITREITGDGNYPKVEVMMGLNDMMEEKKYISVYFNLINETNYLLNNIRGDIVDTESLAVMGKGIYLRLKGNTIASRAPSEIDFKEWEFINTFDVGTLGKSQSQLIYATAFGVDDLREAYYEVRVLWSRGSIFIKVKFKAEEAGKVVVESLVVNFNGDTQTETSKYFSLKQ